MSGVGRSAGSEEERAQQCGRAVYVERQERGTDERSRRVSPCKSGVISEIKDNQRKQASKQASKQEATNDGRWRGLCLMIVTGSRDVTGRSTPTRPIPGPLTHTTPFSHCASIAIDQSRSIDMVLDRFHVGLSRRWIGRRTTPHTPKRQGFGHDVTDRSNHAPGFPPRSIGLSGADPLIAGLWPLGSHTRPCALRDHESARVCVHSLEFWRNAPQPTDGQATGGHLEFARRLEALLNP